MKIEQLCVDNLREGVFCGQGQQHGPEVYDQLEAWLQGDLLRGQVAKDDEGRVAGFTLYYPIEEAPLDVTGEGLYMVQCLFVKPEYQDRGIGRALLESAMADARNQGAAGLAVEAYHGVKRAGFDYMPSTFFQHLGMKPGESRGSATLFLSMLDSNGRPPKYLQRSFEPPGDGPRLRIDILDCRRCYVRATNTAVVKAVAEAVESIDAEVVVHDQNSREAILDKGMSSGVFIDGKLTFFQGPISEQDVWNAIQIADTARKHASDR